MSKKIICFGELLIDFVPTENGVSLAEAKAFKKAPGGAPANVAVGLARLGRPAAFMGKVGEDEFGRMLAQVLADNGVDIGPLRFDKKARTALAFVTLRADGEREFMFYRHPSADMLLTPTEIDHELIRRAAVFHFGSISLIAEPCRSAHLAAVETAQEAGVLLSYDPNLRLPLWPDAAAAKEGILSIWHAADVIKISEDELIFLTGEDSHDAARSLWHDRLKLLLVTEGRKGSRFYSPDAQGEAAGFDVAAVDTTGAGDAFMAGVLSRLGDEPDIWRHPSRVVDALRFANAAGAITTTGRGAIPSLPTAEQITQLMSGQL